MRRALVRLFSFCGRSGRVALVLVPLLWLGVLCGSVIAFVAVGLAVPDVLFSDAALAAALAPACVGLAVSMAAVCVRRAHDLGLSGWWLAPLLPLTAASVALAWPAVALAADFLAQPRTVPEALAFFASPAWAAAQSPPIASGLVNLAGLGYALALTCWPGGQDRNRYGEPT